MVRIRIVTWFADDLEDDVIKRTSRVMIIQVGESGAAYVREPPQYDGFVNQELDHLGGLREKPL